MKNILPLLAVQNSKKIAFYTLGCKLNFAETSTIFRDCEEAGFAKVDWQDQPDFFVLNTCSVTENADKKCRRIIEQVRNSSPEVFVAVIGCYAQLKPEAISAIPGVNLVLGAGEKFNLHTYLHSANNLDEVRIENSPIKDVRSFEPSHSAGDRTRSFLKIQDGCDYFCSFCTIPLARGRSRSGSIQSVLNEAKIIASKGIKEVVLTGVNIGDFGKNTEEDFYQLIQELDRIEGIDRFRISSIEPNLLRDEIIEFTAMSRKFVPHFHIPLQSGSDKILQLMRRRYNSELYTNRVLKIKALMPDACIGVDVIVGYPGESDEDFETTYTFIQELPVSYLHVFTYSERSNTIAVRSNEVVPMNVRRERSKRLRILSEKKKRAFYQSQLGKSKTVLWEGGDEQGLYTGFTENYVKVGRYGEGVNLRNRQEIVHLKEISNDDYVWSEPEIYELHSLFITPNNTL